jgi:PPOX class probable F420-dependent enzyme
VTPVDLTPDALQFLTERHLATLTTLRADGTPHVTPVGFTWDAEAGVARVICGARSIKARNVRATGVAVLCQVDGRWWLTLEGRGQVFEDPTHVADAVRRYTDRYQPPRANPERVAIDIAVTRVLGSARNR